MKTHRTPSPETNQSKSPDKSGNAINRSSRAALLVTLCLLPLLLAACDNFERDAYRTLKLVKVEYELLQDHAARATVRGQMTTEQWERFTVSGRRFIAAHTLAADLLATYANAKKAGGETERDRLRERIQTAIARLPILLGDLHVLLDSLKTPADPAAAPTATSQHDIQPEEK